MTNRIGIMKCHKAHWSTLLVVGSALQTALCVTVAVIAFRNGASWIGFLLLALIAGCALFAIRGYTVTPDSIFATDHRDAVVLRYVTHTVVVSTSSPEDLVRDLSNLINPNN